MKCFIKIMILCSITLLIILTGCNNNEKRTMFDEDRMYLGFNDINHELTIEECESKGYIVIKGVEIVANQLILEDFFEESNAERESYIRFANFNDDSSNGMYYTDLIYDEDGYSYFYDDEENLKKDPYKYLHILKGKLGMPLKDHGMVVVSDKEELTLHDVTSSMISSSMVYINSVGRYRIVLSDYGDFY